MWGFWILDFGFWIAGLRSIANRQSKIGNRKCRSPGQKTISAFCGRAGRLAACLLVQHFPIALLALEM